MSARNRKLWLVAYDIRDSKRLQHVHKYLKIRGMHLQYSVFGLECDDRGMRDILADLELLIDNKCDDVRAYHIPDRCQVWLLGNQSLPEGMELAGSKVMKLLERRPGGLPPKVGPASASPLPSNCRARENKDKRPQH